MSKKTLIKENNKLTETLSMQIIVTSLCICYAAKNIPSPLSAADKTLFCFVVGITAIDLFSVVTSRILFLIERAAETKARKERKEARRSRVDTQDHNTGEPETEATNSDI